MQRALASTTLLALLALAGCSESPTAEPLLHHSPGHGGGPGGGNGDGTPPIELTVSFRGDPGDAATNDGGVYVHGVSDVIARIEADPASDFYGQFQFSTDADTKKRSPEFRTALVEVQPFFQQQAVVIKALGNGLDGAAFLALQNAGETSTTRLKLSWNDDAGTHYDLRYGSECGATSGRPDEEVLVILTATSPRVWIMSNQGGALLCRQLPPPQGWVEDPVTAPIEVTLTEQP